MQSADVLKAKLVNSPTRRATMAPFFMISVATCGAMVTWMLIFLTHVAYRRRHQPAPGAFRLPGGPWPSLVGAVLMAAVLLTTAFTETFRMTLVVGLPCFALLLATYWIWFRLRATGVR